MNIPSDLEMLHLCTLLPYYRYLKKKEKDHRAHNIGHEFQSTVFVRVKVGQPFKLWEIFLKVEMPYNF